MDKTLFELKNMKAREKNEFINNISKVLADDFELTPDKTLEHLPVFKHKKTQMEFVYIPSGSYKMGLSIKEEKAAEELYSPIPATLENMRPLKNLTVKSFLVSRTPVTNIILSKYSKVDYLDLQKPFYPAYVDRSVVDETMKILNCRLIFENEWEYICRADTKTLFVWGDDLPLDLGGWLSLDFSDLQNLTANPFGLYGMYSGEWCYDYWRESYNLPFPKHSTNFVVRGGGSVFWPWQDEEWVWCMSAMRCPSKFTIDEKAAFRLIYDLN